MSKRFIWFCLLCLAYSLGCLITFISLNKSTLELSSYRTMVSSVPARITDPMSQYVIDDLVLQLEKVQFGGDLSDFGVRFQTHAAASYLGSTSFDFESAITLLKQGRLRAAQAKFQLLASKVDSVYDRRLKLLSRLSIFAAITALLLTAMFIFFLYRTKSSVIAEIELPSEQEIESGKNFPDYLQSVVEEEVKFVGHRAQLSCIGFDHEDLNVDTEHALQLRETMELIAEQLVRNSIEHGGRRPEARLLAGKTEYLSVRVSLLEQGDHWLLSVWDNGEGLDGELLMARALALGLLNQSAAEKLAPAQRIKLIFLAGFSTRERSVSVADNDRTLAEIRAVLKPLNGVISVQNQANVSCQFTIRFPKF